MNGATVDMYMLAIQLKIQLVFKKSYKQAKVFCWEDTQ